MKVQINLKEASFLLWLLIAAVIGVVPMVVNLVWSINQAQCMSGAVVAWLTASFLIYPVGWVHGVLLLLGLDGLPLHTLC